MPTDTVVTATTLKASKPIYLLAVDETHVAVAYQARKNCIESWDVAARKVVRFAEGSCENDPDSETTDVFGLAVAGDRLAWAGGMYTNHDWEWVTTATTKATKDVGVFGMEDEGVIYGPLGDGDVIVFSYTADWERLARGTLYRVTYKPGAVTKYGSCDSCSVQLRSDRVPLTVDAGRIAAQTPSGSVELLNASGKTLRTFPTKLKKNGRAAVQGNRLVVQQGKSAIVYDTDTGKRLASWPLGTGALEDMQGDVAVYIAGRRIHLLRLSDGRDVSIRPPGSGDVLAQIESSGLFYAYNVDRGKRGRATFVPFDELPLEPTT